MNRLDAIKRRAALVAGNREGLEPTFPEIAAIIRLATFDAPPLIAAVEAVLAIHKPMVSSPGNYCKSCGDERLGEFLLIDYPCPTVTAISEALGETE